MSRKSLIRYGNQWHRAMAWCGGIVLVLFVLSGATHILMTWTGPQQKQFFAPQLQLPAGYAANVSAILRQHHIDSARTVKIVATEKGPLLQVGIGDADTKRYFDLEQLTELPDYDRTQATWLARYYTGSSDGVASIMLQTRFDNAYPWVNRLLPVYRVEFAGEDHLTAYIHTETASLASLTNDYKTTLQAIFGIVHTWNFLDSIEALRVALISAALATSLALLLAGVAMIFAIKKRNIANTQRRWHRRIAIAVWVPLLLFITSGLYHLYQNALGENSRGLRAAPDLALEGNSSGATVLGDMKVLLENGDSRLANAVSLVQGPDKRLYYRIAIAPNTGAVSREQRFAGQPQQLDGTYINAASGASTSLTDAELSRHYAARFFDISDASMAEGNKITFFDMDYDFRNKRLPVWQFEHGGTTIFVDPASATIVDVVTAPLRYEGWSFSVLHKWNVLVPLLGRGGRDALMATLLLTTVALAALGFLLKNRRN